MSECPASFDFSDGFVFVWFTQTEAVVRLSYPTLEVLSFQMSLLGPRLQLKDPSFI